MAKNIINEIGFRIGAASGPPGWYAPSDGSRTNIMTPEGSGVIPEQGEGYGLKYDLCNGQRTDLNEPTTVTIIDDDGEPLNVNRARWSVQRDKEYLDFVTDFPYQAGCLKIIIKKNCWLLIEGTAVTIGPALGTETETTGISIRRNNGTAWYGPPIAGYTVINEPGGRGVALHINSTHHYRAGDIIKIACSSTFQTELRPINIESGAMHCESYLAITRISND